MERFPLFFIFLFSLGDHRMKQLKLDFHEKFNWKAAYNLSPTEEALLETASELERESFLRSKMAYLDGLGPEGYALLKVGLTISKSFDHMREKQKRWLVLRIVKL